NTTTLSTPNSRLLLASGGRGASPPRKTLLREPSHSTLRSVMPAYSLAPRHIGRATLSSFLLCCVLGWLIVARAGDSFEGQAPSDLASDKEVQCVSQRLRAAR